MYVRGDATLRWLRTYIAWRADQLSDVRQLPLDIYSNDDGLCIFSQDRALGGEARTNEHYKPIPALVRYCVYCSDSCTPM